MTKKQTILNEWQQPHGSSHYRLISIGLSGCPYSIELARRIRHKTFWLTRDDPRYEILKSRYRHPTYPIALAVPTSLSRDVRSLDDLLPRPKGIVRIGGLSEMIN